MIKKLYIFCIFLLCSISVNCFVAPGDLDITFNSLGVQPGTVAKAIESETVYSVSYCTAIQENGKIVLAGTSYVNPVNEMALARFNADGSLDENFNPGGLIPGTKYFKISSTDGESIDSQIYGLAIDGNGKIVIAGIANIGGLKFAVARLNQNGAFDTTFNFTGMAVTTIDGEASYNYGQGLALQADGRIVVVGTAKVGDIYRFGVARFNTDGTLDTNFNPAGPGVIQPGTKTFTIDGLDIESGAYCVAIQEADQKIVVAGVVKTDDTTYRLAIARLNPDGSLDTDFYSGGTQPGTEAITIDGVNIDNEARAIAIQADGKIVVDGYTDLGGQVYKLAVARFNSNGSLDTTFNPAPAIQPGTLAITIDNKNITRDGNSVKIQSDGQIIVSGTIEDSGLFRFALARLNSLDGSLDATFNPAPSAQPGTKSTEIDNINNQNYGQSLAIQSDGKIVLGGYSYIDEHNKFSVARFIAEEDIPPVPPVPSVPVIPTRNPFALRLIEKYGRLLG